MRTVFFSWQSDTPGVNNRALIRTALQETMRDFERDIEVDENTRALPGSPQIFESLLSKISKASAFVADLTIIGHTSTRASSNPNVLIEYGYALAKLGDERIISIMNTAFGNPEELPFDLRGRAVGVTYELGQDASESERREASSQLKEQLGRELRHILLDARSMLSLSDDEYQIAKHLLDSDPDARIFRHMDQPEIAKALGFSESAVATACAELCSRGYAERLNVLGTGKPPVKATYQLLWDLDPLIHGWSPREDSLTITERLIEQSDSGNGRLGIPNLQSDLGWTLRRINAGLHFLVEHDIVRSSSVSGTEFVTRMILESDQTRAFIRNEKLTP